ncbi:MAG TPA: TAT-variant-translocated molybdopterin oxidoreductase, partial [Blastocatellia bacterium]|nr:TAT-variant-translocated molybdopterin oxidoreductase [Blastocatellia bacterium]
MNKGNDLDLTSIGSRLNASSGKEFWRSLEELADTDEFQELLHREFPQQASEFTDPVGRRRFLKLMGASLALAGLTACTRQPTEIITPYVRQPEELVPGKPLFYATAMPLDGIGTGLLVENHEGRPTKVEGNPDHPASLGATDTFAQAAILSLYDPDRSQTLTYLGEIQPWSAFLGAIRPALSAQQPLGGAGLRILTETVTSPTLANQLRNILAAYPSAKWHQYDPAGRGSAREGGRAAFGQYVNTIYKFEKADVILSIDSDFLNCGPASLVYSREFASRRRVNGEAGEANAKGMSRLYAVESTPTLTGAKADHKIPLRPSQVEPFPRAMAAALGVQGARAGSVEGVPADWIPAVARDLQGHRG